MTIAAPSTAVTPATEAMSSHRRHAPVAHDSAHDHKLRILRELRAEIQDLQAVLARIRSGSEPLRESARYFEKTMADIHELMPMVARSDEAVDDSDALRHLLNQVERMDGCRVLIDPTASYSPEELMAGLTELDEVCHTMIVTIGDLTIPSRLREWISKAWAGYYVSFHDVFDDELPQKEDRQRLLNHLAYAPTILGDGLVDPVTGFVYRFHANRFARYATLAGIVLAVAASAVIASVWNVAQHATSEQGSALLNVIANPSRWSLEGVTWWLAVVLGVGAHYVVEKAKQAQSAGAAPGSLAIGHLTHRVDAHVGLLLFKLALMLFVYFGVYALDKAGRSPMNFFLAGYSLDSFVGIVAGSLDRRAAARFATLKKQLGADGV